MAAAFFALLLLIWDAAFRARIWSPVLLPSPWQVAIYLKDTALDGTLLKATVITMRRLLVGYIIGLVVGLPLGLLTARWKLFGDTIGTMALGLQTLPSVCWVPLALLWFGQTEAAMLFVVVMGTLWSVVIATETGVRNVPPIYRRAALTMGSKRLHMWFKVILPAALPFIVSGMKQGWAFAWRSLMAAEIFVTILTGFGLGQLLHYGRELSAMDQVIADHARDRRHRFACGQNLLFADREIPPSTLGHEPGMSLREKRAPISVQREVRITNELGLHARPAAQFVRRANRFRSEIWIVREGKRYSATSLIEILRANLDCGATATLEAHGVDADEAIDELEKLLAEFREKDEG